MEKISKMIIVKKGLATILLYFGLSRVLSILFAGLLNSVLSSNSSNKLSEPHFLIIMFLTNVITCFCLYAINFKEIRVNFINNIKKTSTYKTVFIGFILFLVLSIILGLIVQIFGISIVESENQKQIVDLANKGNPLLFFLSVVVVAPILEEIVFRYSLVGLIEQFITYKRLKFIPYLLAAIIFGMLHDTTVFTNFSVESLILFLRYLLPSLVIVSVYYISDKNLISVILVHAVFNLVSLFSVY